MNLYYNTTAQCRVDENNVRIAAKPVLHYAACPEWVLHFYSGDPSETPVPVDLSDIVSWRAAVDSDWNSSTEPMCRTLAADIDASGKAQGVIRVPVNANTARYLAVVQGKQSVGGWFELRGFDDSGNVALVVLLTITCNNSIDPTGGAEPEPVDNDTATMTWVRAVIAQQLYYQYSADGSTWHNPPMVAGTDVYFRVKHGADGTPSAAQLIPYGPQGEPGQFEDTSYLTFDSVSASNLVTLTTACKPVAIRSGITGNYYPVEKGSVTLGTGSFTLDVTPYLAYDNAQTFSGTWTVFMAAGLPGDQQDGNEIITLTGTAITPAPNVVFKKTLAASDAFTIDTSALTATRQLTFELHLTQPSTAVTFTLPDSLVWPIGDEFTSTASPPAMSTGGMMYAIVIRWDGENLLANLAYTKGAIA